MRTYYHLFLKNKIAVLALLSFFSIIAISYIRTCLDLEDAEQAYYTQWWQLGYNDQPPLYTWIQKTGNYIFGVTRLSFSGLRALIFSLTLIALYKFARNYLKDKSTSELAVLILVLIPTFSDLTFRRLSHTSLLCLIAILTYWCILRLKENRSWGHYCLLGGVMAMGFLTKYNYAMIFLSLMLIPFADTEMRKVIWNPRFLLSLFIGFIIVSPHLYWIITHQEYLREMRTGLAIKTKADAAGHTAFLSPALAFLKTLFKLVTPLAILMVAGLLSGTVTFTKRKKSWLLKMLLVQLLVIIAFFITLDINRGNVRWLLPILFPFTVLLAEHIEIKSSLKTNPRLYFVFIAFIAFQLIRIPGERIIGYSAFAHHSFEGLAHKLRDEHREKTWILPDVTYAGEIRYLVPGKKVCSNEDLLLKEKIAEPRQSLFILKDDELPPAGFRQTDSIPDYGIHGDFLRFFEK